MRATNSPNPSRPDDRQSSLFGDAVPNERPSREPKRQPRSPMSESLLDAGEAAELLNVPRSTLYELVRSRGLPHVRVGRRGMRFTRSDLSYWIAGNTVRGGRG